MIVSALRPGSRLGVYPQRNENPLTPFERIGRDALARLRQTFSRRAYQLERVVKQVNQAAIGLESLDQDALQQQVNSIHYALLRDGLEDSLVHRCFALIRESAARSLQM